MVRNKTDVVAQKSRIYGNLIRQRIDYFPENVPQVPFQGGVPVLFKQRVKKGQRKKLPLSQKDAFYKKVIFGIIIAAPAGIIGNRGVIKKPEVINIPQDGPGSNLCLFGKAGSIGIRTGTDMFINEE
jgi:hypothetical protein